MGRFKGKRAKRLFLANKKPSVYQRHRQKVQDVTQSPFKSPVKKKPKQNASPYKANLSKIRSPKGKYSFPKVVTPQNKRLRIRTPKSKVGFPNMSTPKKSKRKLINLLDHNYSVNTGSDGQRVAQRVDSGDVQEVMEEASPMPELSMSLDDTLELINPNETFEFNAIDSLEESFRLTEICTNQQGDFHDNYETELVSKVLEQLKNNNLKYEFLSFLELVSNDRFPLTNVAFRLFLDVVKWYSCGDSRGMRYDDTTLRFFWLGKKVFCGKFLRFMAGPKTKPIFSWERRLCHPYLRKSISRAQVHQFYMNSILQEFTMK